MHGNVWEWCLDNVLVEEESKSPIRGGGWDSRAVSCRSATSRWERTNWNRFCFGLRIVLVDRYSNTRDYNEETGEVTKSQIPALKQKKSQ